MGNRAVITTSHSYDVQSSNDIGLYLHWNGGYDSVSAFLRYCKLRGFRPPEQDGYGWARLCQVIGNFFGGGLSIGIEKCCKLDCNNGNNGVYVIRNWEIVDRMYYDGPEQKDHQMDDMLKQIDNSQPESERLGDYMFAKTVTTDKLKVGDMVYVTDYDGTCPKAFPIVLIKDNVPYVNKYPAVFSDDITTNPNNAIKDKKVKIKEN